MTLGEHTNIVWVPHLTITKYSSHADYLLGKSREVVTCDGNLITTFGVQVLAGALISDPLLPGFRDGVFFHVGSSDTAASQSQKSLIAPISDSMIDLTGKFTRSGSSISSAKMTFEVGQYIASWNEWGLYVYNQDHELQLFNRRVDKLGKKLAYEVWTATLLINLT